MSDGNERTSRPSAWITEYGMMWQPEDSTATIRVDRVITVRGTAVLRVVVEAPGMEVEDSPHLQISVSPKGRSVRVFPVRKVRVEGP